MLLSEFYYKEITFFFDVRCIFKEAVIFMSEMKREKNPQFSFSSQNLGKERNFFFKLREKYNFDPKIYRKSGI